MLFFVLEPSDLDKISWIPANSRTARTAPPAITPVPGAAGLNTTLAAPATPYDSCAIVLLSVKGTLIKFLLAAWIAFLLHQVLH